MFAFLQSVLITLGLMFAIVVIGMGMLGALNILLIVRRALRNDEQLRHGYIAFVLLLTLFPATVHLGWILAAITLTVLACDYVVILFNRFGPASTPIQALNEIWAMLFLVGLVCLAFSLPPFLPFVVTFLGWPLSNAIAKRREWPYLMETAGR